jgi:hypothetical protein
MNSLLMLAVPALASARSLWPRSNHIGGKSNGYDCETSPFKHVVAISVDGLHASDVGKWTLSRPTSNFSRLLSHGYQYTDSFTSAPSDSFPGTLAQYTGATPKTTGVWYDDTWDWTFYAPGSGCAGKPGAEGIPSVINISNHSR